MCGQWNSSRAIAVIAMGRKKHNLCSGCGFRHAAPAGKACTAGVGMQTEENVGKSILEEQGPNQEGLDAHDLSQ